MDAPHGVCSSVESSVEYQAGRKAALSPVRQVNPHKPGSPAAMRWAYGHQDMLEVLRKAERAGVTW